MSYRVVVRMIDFLNKMFRWNAVLAGTYGERNDPRKDRSWNWKRRGILGQRKIVHHEILLSLFQERLDTSLQFLCTKSRVILRIGVPRSW